jgi:hypothetical protein
MTIATIDESQHKAARVAGFAYLATFATVVAANYGILERISVPGDAAATARNILAHEGLFRLNIAAFTLYSAGLLVLLTALYVMLKPVNRPIALVAAFSRLVFALLWLGAPLGMFFALRVLNADYLQILGADKVVALAKLYQGGGFEAYYIGLPFFGLASTLTFYLLYKSNFFPKGLAVFGAVSSAWCVVTAFAFLIIPHFDKTVNLYWLDSALGISELVTGGWLLFKGIRPHGLAELSH